MILKCTKCGKHKYWYNFTKQKCNSYRFGLHCWCKDCINSERKGNEKYKQTGKLWTIKNTKHLREYQRKKKQTKQYKIMKAKSDRKYYLKNKDKIIKYISKYKKENRERYNILNNMREARKRANTPDSYDREMVERLYLLSNIFTKDLWQPYHVDHIKPLSKGGEHRASNLQVVTAKQNLSKCNDEFSKLKGIRKQDLINHSEIFDLIESECAKVPFMNKPQGPLK